MPEEKMITRKS